MLLQRTPQPARSRVTWRPHRERTGNAVLPLKYSASMLGRDHSPVLSYRERGGALSSHLAAAPASEGEAAS